jgi:fructokinase
MDITALGELLIDFTDAGESPEGKRVFERNPGGAPANVCVAAAKLGLNTAFIGKVGADIHGRFLSAELQSRGIDCRGLILDASHNTTLAFVQFSGGAEREFSFFRGADIMLRSDELNLDLIANSRILHIGTLLMTSEPGRTAVLDAVKHAKRSGVAVSLDVNYRPALWSSESAFTAAVQALMPYVDFLKLSEEEYKIVNTLAPVTAVTMGANGSDLIIGGVKTHVPAVPAERVVDTTGAGDAYWAGILTEYLNTGTINGALAAKLGAECVAHRGAW